MDFNELISKLREALDIAEELNEQQINEMTIHKSKADFDYFYKDSLERYFYKKQRSQIKDPKEKFIKFPKLEYEDVLNAKEYQGILVTNGSIEHVYNEHPELNENDWKEFLSTFNPSKDGAILGDSKKKDEKKYIYKCNNGNSYFGYVIRTFPKAQAQLVTMFKGHKNSVDNWIQNQINKNEKDMD